MEDRDIKEFRRLRNYYRINFKSGHSDESFVLWCEVMLRWPEKEPLKLRSNHVEIQQGR